MSDNENDVNKKWEDKRKDICRRKISSWQYNLYVGVEGTINIDKSDGNRQLTEELKQYLLYIAQ